MSIDIEILRYLNSFAGSSALIDTAVYGLSQCNLVKGLLFMPILWWLWMRNGSTLQDNDAFLIKSLAGLFVTIVLSRSLQLLLPFRVRPLEDPTLALTIPAALHRETWQFSSSFPSDHAAMFAALATIIWTRHRTLGAVAFGWTVSLILVPRIYLGLHYPTDIIVGATIGIGIATAAICLPVPGSILAFAHEVQRKYPGLFFAFFFFLSAETAVLFDDTRHAFSGVVSLARLVWASDVVEANEIYQ